MTRLGWVILAAAAVTMGGCPFGSGQRNPFIPLTEEFGARSLTTADTGTTTGRRGNAATEQFRATMSVTLANLHPDDEVNTSFMAWVLPSSIRSADQQDALLNSNYVQLSSEVKIGTVFTLPPGTFVFNGPGVGGATSIRLAPTRDAAVSTQLGDPTVTTVTTTPGTAVERRFDLVTPDAFLVFSQPPVSCESVAFAFTIDGDPVTSTGFGGTNIFGGPDTTLTGLKTLSQVDAYQCAPFKPGMFLRIGGGQAGDNEFFEGQGVRFDFLPAPLQDTRFFVQVTKDPL